MIAREDDLSVAGMIGDVTHQVTEAVTVTARGDETYAALSARVKEVLPAGFNLEGGLHRIRVGDPRPFGGTYDFDRNAHVAFVRHHPRTTLFRKSGATDE